jgi:NADH oxidase (H2O2-forming)
MNLISDSVLESNKIELILDEAISLDSEAKQITCREKTIAYDRLVLVTGGTPIEPDIPGIDKEGVFSVQKDIKYLDQILAYLENVKKAIILGGGFIGVEFADELRKRGIEVTVVEMLPHCLMLALDKDICGEAEEKMTFLGIHVVTGTKLEEIAGNDRVTGVRLSDGRVIDTDMVLLGIGIKPNVSLAVSAGLPVVKGGIVVDKFMRTSDEAIYACGDCTAKKSFFTGKETLLKLTSIATMEARIAGANLYENRRSQEGVIGIFSTIIDDLVFSVAGLTEEEARKDNYEVACGSVEKPNRHPAGMPGMVPMKVKLVFNRGTGELIGGRARGGESVGKMINTVSACIQKRMTADEIATFQLGTHPAVTGLSHCVPACERRGSRCWSDEAIERALVYSNRGRHEKGGRRAVAGT